MQLLQGITFTLLLALSFSFLVRAFLNSVFSSPNRSILAWIMVMVTDVVLGIMCALTAFYIQNWT